MKRNDTLGLHFQTCKTNNLDWFQTYAYPPSHVKSERFWLHLVCVEDKLVLFFNVLIY